jgi:hypothetical protein
MALVGNISYYILQEMAKKADDNADARKNAVIADAKSWLATNHPELVDVIDLNGTLYAYLDSIY